MKFGMSVFNRRSDRKIADFERIEDMRKPRPNGFTENREDMYNAMLNLILKQIGFKIILSIKSRVIIDQITSQMGIMHIDLINQGLQSQMEILKIEGY